MKKYLLPFLVLCWPSWAWAQQSVAFSNLLPAGSFCQLSAMSAIGFSSCTGGVPAPATVAVVVVETADVRWRDDGTAPSSSVGMLTASGSTLVYQGDLTKVQFIAVSGSPVLDISFYKTR